MPVDFKNQAVSIFTCLAASVIEFSTTADNCNISDSVSNCKDSKVAWALACGVVSTFLCLFALLLTRVWLQRPGIVDLLLSLALLGIWIFGAAFNTSNGGIYYDTGNGYFSTWIALLAAANYAHLAFGNVTDKLKQHISGASPVLVLVASVVELSVAADTYAHRDSPDYAGLDEARVEWAVACGCVSAFLCIVQLLLLYTHSPVAVPLGKGLSVLLVALWAAGAGVNTSAKGPFSSTNNGYFFSWFAFGASLFYAYSVFAGNQEGTYEPAPVADKANEPPILPDPVVGTGAGYQTLPQ